MGRPRKGLAMRRPLAFCIVVAAAGLALVFYVRWIIGEVPSTPGGAGPATNRDASEPKGPEASDAASNVRVAAEDAPTHGPENELDTESDRMSLDELPEPLRSQAEIAVRACKFSCEKLGGEWPRGVPTMTLSGARKMVAAEDALRAEILAHARNQQAVLVTRMEADPALGIKIDNKEVRGLDVQMREEYPGWPEGYLYARIDNGRQSRVAAWRIKGDEELEALRQYGVSLRGEYACAIRASYIRELLFR